MARTASLTNREIPMLVIRPSRGWSALNLRDMWTYRELLYFMVWRDVKVRYKQAVLGVAWAVLSRSSTSSSSPSSSARSST